MLVQQIGEDGTDKNITRNGSRWEERIGNTRKTKCIADIRSIQHNPWNPFGTDTNRLSRYIKKQDLGGPRYERELGILGKH